MPDELKPQVDLEPEPQAGSVEVDLEAKPAPQVSKEDELVKKLESSISLKYDKVLKNLENQLAGARRIIERQETQLKGTQQPPPQKEEPQVYTNELDKLKSEDPWKAVEILAEQKAQKLFQDKEAKQQLAELSKNRAVAMEKSLGIVRKEYPELFTESDDGLNEEQTLVRSVYSEVMNEFYGDQQIVDPNAPISLKDEMERRLLQRGVDIPIRRKRELYMPSKQPAARRSGGLETSLPPGRTSSDSKYTLTPEEKAMCDTYGIPLEEFARVAKTLETPGGEVTA